MSDTSNTGTERAVLAGGCFWVESAPGRGTTLELRLGAAA